MVSATILVGVLNEISRIETHRLRRVDIQYCRIDVYVARTPMMVTENPKIISALSSEDKA